MYKFVTKRIEDQKIQLSNFSFHFEAVAGLYRNAIRMWWAQSAAALINKNTDTRTAPIPPHRPFLHNSRLKNTHYLMDIFRFLLSKFSHLSAPFVGNAPKIHHAQKFCWAAVLRMPMFIPDLDFSITDPRCGTLHRKRIYVFLIHKIVTKLSKIWSEMFI